MKYTFYIIYKQNRQNNIKRYKKMNFFCVAIGKTDGEKIK